MPHSQDHDDDDDWSGLEEWKHHLAQGRGHRQNRATARPTNVHALDVV